MKMLWEMRMFLACVSLTLMAIGFVMFPNQWISGVANTSKSRQLTTETFSGHLRMPSTGLRVAFPDIVTLERKVKGYNNALDWLRKEMLSTPKTFNVTFNVSDVVHGNMDDYLVKLSQIESVEGIFLDWSTSRGISQGKSDWSSFHDTSNLLIHEYFPWAGSDTVCRYLNQTSFTRHNFDTIFNKQCVVKKTSALKKTSMELFILNAIQISPDNFFPNAGHRFPERIYTDLPKFSTYMHVIKDAYSTNNGEVFTMGHKIVPFNCRPNFKPEFPKTHHISYHKEILSISQYWGKGFFHKMLEDFTKLSPYLDFLKRNSDIKVHVAETGSSTVAILKVLGIAEHRLVTGVVRADIVYLPRGTFCGKPHVTETQLLSKQYHAYIGSIPSQKTRNMLVLIRRSRMRYFTKGKQISEGLRKLATEFGLEFYLFKDNPVPSLNETMLAFNRAVMVVAPHGAGLSNLLFSHPGTYVIEGLCNPPHTNMCYTRTAYILGHHYHALISSKGCEGHINIAANEVINAAKEYLILAQKFDSMI